MRTERDSAAEGTETWEGAAAQVEVAGGRRATEAEAQVEVEDRRAKQEESTEVVTDGRVSAPRGKVASQGQSVWQQEGRSEAVATK